MAAHFVEGTMVLGLACQQCRALTPIFADKTPPIIGRFAFACMSCGSSQEGETKDLQRFAGPGARKQAAA